MALARLGLTPEEKEKFTEELNQILAYAERLGQLDTKDTPATTHSLPLENVYREDVHTPWSNPAGIVQAAPAAEAGFFKVPRILE